jgi:hypothetical protein
MKRRIKLTFVLNDDGDVSPDYIALRVAEACFAHFALRGNEGIVLPSNPKRVLVAGSKGAIEQEIA